MAKKVQLKTQKNEASVQAFISTIEDAGLRADSKQLLTLFEEITGVAPKMWGGSIIGFGEYTYYRSNGDQGTYMATGFSPRKSGPTIYIMPGYQNYDAMLQRLGPYKLGKSCLYLKSLESIDLDCLKELIETGLNVLKKGHATSFD
ncbi:DUF1801 domain-containing protein [Pararhizobium sp. IMCC21322]|uniref:DUF1801 domain-containing protein n=1 Tax=Pararhizobium sp. IMCC21322 TaxID=3067903 RepID=UPI002740A547|nr:DUF1801 domain-containing protein [Pararhizobium sp. IMCC21322]